MDQQLLYLFNRTWTSPALDWVMALASNTAVWMPILLLTAGMMLIFGNFRVRAFVLCAGMTLGMVDGVTTKFLKRTVARPRPNDVRSDVRMVDLAKAKPRLFALGKPLQIKMSRPSEKPVAGNSFPSGHTSNTFAVATLAAVFFPRRGWLCVFPAALVAYSRIYVGSHYPTDVLVSIFLAVGEALILLALFSAAWARLAPTFFPKTAAAHPSLLA